MTKEFPNRGFIGISTRQMLFVLSAHGACGRCTMRRRAADTLLLTLTLALVKV